MNPFYIAMVQFAKGKMLDVGALDLLFKSTSQIDFCLEARAHVRVRVRVCVSRLRLLL